jgi:hypothetical protein
MSELNLKERLKGSVYAKKTDCIVKSLEQRGVQTEADLEAVVAQGNVCGENIYSLVAFLLAWQAPAAKAEAEAQVEEPGVETVDGVGPKLKAQLNKLGIHTVAALASADPATLEEAGIPNAVGLIAAAKGG